MIHNLNKSKWFGSRPVLYFMPDQGGGGGGASGGSGGSGSSGGGAGTGGGAGAGGGSGAGGGTGGDGGGAGAGGAGGAAGGGQGAAAGTVDWKTAPEHFRKGYDELRAKYEPFEKLGIGAEQITAQGQSWGRISEAALTIGDQLAELGVEYTEDEILEMLAERPVDTLNFLQNKLAKVQEEGGGEGGGDQDLEAAIEAGISRRMGPIEKRENERMTNEANALFERTAFQEFTKVFKEENVDIKDIAGEEMFMLISATSELFKYNLDDIHALKHEGKTAPIQKAVRDAKNFLDKYFMARATRERGAVAGGGGKKQAAAGGNGNKWQPGWLPDGSRRATPDELAEHPEWINPAYK